MLTDYKDLSNKVNVLVICVYLHKLLKKKVTVQLLIILQHTIPIIVVAKWTQKYKPQQRKVDNRPLHMDLISTKWQAKQLVLVCCIPWCQQNSMERLPCRPGMGTGQDWFYSKVQLYFTSSFLAFRPKLHIYTRYILAI